MSRVIAFVEFAEGKAKKTSLEAVQYAKQLGGDVIAVAVGTQDEQELRSLGKYGASKVLHVKDQRLDQPLIQPYANVLSIIIEKEQADTLVLANSALGTPVAARVSVKTGASLATNVVDLPDTSSGFVVRKSIFTGKAAAKVELTGARKVIAIRKNAVDLAEGAGDAEVVTYDVPLDEKDFSTKILSTEKAAGEVSLPEAEIVVSGGRGMKGPEHWGLLENLAKELGAALGCSKPVSDMGWRPHHEHVGQTGIKVSPQLYIAVGISGAIQHLAGVNTSKYILVINKDPEAPFFKAADYGVVGDAFDVLPKLTDAIKASR